MASKAIVQCGNCSQYCYPLPIPFSFVADMLDCPETIPFGIELDEGHRLMMACPRKGKLVFPKWREK